MQNKRSTPEFTGRGGTATAKAVHPKSGVTLTRSVADLDRESKELVESALALHPDSPAANVLGTVADIADSDFLAELDASLRTKHFLTLIRAVRAREKREQRESMWLSPKIREAAIALPARVPLGGKKAVKREDLEFPHIGLAIKELNRRDLAQHKTNPKIAALEAIAKLWPRAKRARKMRLLEVDRLS